MAVIWQSQVGGRLYQVRQAGASIRLYTNAVFHSQFNPHYPLGGSIWDLLVLPSLFAPESIRRILVLGLGGGAAVRTLQVLLPSRNITAVEIDPVHLHIAKTYFGVRPNKRTRLIRGDAVAWLTNYHGEPFDFILDDLFIETDGIPDRAVNTNNRWCELLLRHLSPNGVLAINFDSPNAIRRSALIKQPEFSTLFPSRFSLSVTGYDNRIAAFFRTNQNKENLKQTLSSLENEFGKQVTRRLNARIRTI